MNILTQQIDNTPTTTEVAKHIVSRSANAYSQLLNTHEQLTRQLWSNPFYTPEELLAELGTNAGEVLTFHETITSALNTLVTDCAVCESVQPYTVAEDGTVTIDA